MKKLKLACLILVLLLEPWLVSLLHCELLTAKYGGPELQAVCQSYTNMLGEIRALKVLEYDPYTYCRVYIRTADSGDVFLLLDDRDAEGNSAWKVALWDTVWAKYGSADEIIWPYIR